MNKPPINEISQEKKADRLSFVFIGIFTGLSWLTLSITDQIEAGTALSAKQISQIWLTQLTSHIVVLALMPLLPWLLSRFPIRRENWHLWLPALAIGFLTYGAIHVLGMVGFRNALWLLLWGESYEFGLASPVVWFYELQKDLFTFLLQLSAFWFGREIMQARLMEQGRRRAVAESGRVTLHSGGRIHVIDVDDLLYAKAAGNYVEIQTRRQELLVRMTLRELEERLAAHSKKHIRIHRSTLVHLNEVNFLQPDKDGSAIIELNDGVRLRASRTLRGGVEEKLKELEV